MKATQVLSSIFAALIATASFGAETLVPDLKAITSGKGWKGATGIISLTEKDGAPAVAGKGTGVVWLDGFEFANGVIEFDGKGKSGPPQSNFMGITFRVVDEMTHDVVYFRPFNFTADSAERRSHSVQYASHPDWGWERLRQEKPGQYEKAIEPAPDGDAWFHAKVVVEKPKVSVFVNGASEPSLVVNEITSRKGGSVGLYFFASGTIANLKITPTP
jgi:3-keto-disaccharide hydrolase